MEYFDGFIPNQILELAFEIDVDACTPFNDLEACAFSCKIFFEPAKTQLHIVTAVGGGLCSPIRCPLNLLLDIVETFSLAPSKLILRYCLNKYNN